MLMKNTRVQLSKYIFYSTIIFTISLVMIISSSTDALGDHTDCTLKSPPIWDMRIESDEYFTITWDNPQVTSDAPGLEHLPHCRYDVSLYHDSQGQRGGGEFLNEKHSWTGKWPVNTGTKYFKICPTNDNGCKSNSVLYSFVIIPNLSKQNTSIDCTLKSPPIWDKTIEVNESIWITWDSPDIQQCSYDVTLTENNISETFTENISSVSFSTTITGEHYFKICPTNYSACSSEFGPINVLNTEMNNFFIILVIGVTLAGISILFVIKKKGSTASSSTPASSTPASSTPASSTEVSTKKSQEENITDIDKQIAINEEKIRKIEEESKKLDEES
jgi:hypothetical protein